MFGPRGAGSSRSSDDLHNEDAFLVADDLGLYVVCDGRGDAPGGEVAAYLAVDAISEHLEDVLRVRPASESEGPAALQLDSSVSCGTIEASIRLALESIVEAAGERPELDGMASTVTLLLVQRGRAYIGHIGDSRAYLARGARLVQLTTDEEWTDSEVRDAAETGSGIETFTLPTRAGDTFILCTDGASAEIGNAGRVDAIQDYSPRLVASRIAAAAHRNRPDEDATVVVVRIRDEHEHAWVNAPGPLGLDARTRGLVHRPVGRSRRPAHPFDQLISRSYENVGRSRSGSRSAIDS